jgi:hypothetical protein
MTRNSNLARTFASALVITLGFLPAAALANDNGGSGTVFPMNIFTHGEAGDSEGISTHSTTTAGIHNDTENDNSDNNNQGDEASSTTHHQNNDFESATSSESDAADSDIEVGRDSADTATTTIDAPEHVSNHGELRSFLNHVVKGDDRITDVHVSSTSVETRYEMPAKFLWTIPTNLTADVSVNSAGSVTITYPWYAFLFAKHDSDIVSQLEQSTATSTNATTTLSANTQAHLLNLILSILKGSAQK